ncbi:MAG: hypothetical protein OEZ01_08240 [Candidatus Heimdallarchaeota archaeon]|nr:hypothetical protein [Candidatus Heimdallarchaeota archaeon]
MKTWFNVWPILIAPLFILVPVGFLPAIKLFNFNKGGEDIRILIADTFLDLLPYNQASLFADWYSQASTAKHMLLHVLMAFDINVLLLPILFLWCVIYLKINNIIYKQKLSASRSAIK